MMNNKLNYISLKEAAKYSGYSQEYLSLRARQRKLKAIKIARNWVTTKEWIDEYFKKVGRVKNGRKVHKSHFIVLICLMVFILGCVSVILTSPYFESGSGSIISIIAENIKELSIKENILLGIRVVGDWFLSLNFVQF